MKTISIINLKGGVAKTQTAINLSYILAKFHGKRVLLADNDKQGNTSKAFRVHATGKMSMADIMTTPHADPRRAIRSTRYSNIDVLPANMSLLKADLDVLLDRERPQQTRLRDALGVVADEYDFCVIDNPPDINVSVINALVASNDVIVPVRVDRYAVEGLTELLAQIDTARRGLNPDLNFAGCLITAFVRREEAHAQGAELLRKIPEYKVFDQQIRYSEKVAKSTFAQLPVVEYSRRSAAAIDYVRFVAEYLEKSK